MAEDFVVGSCGGKRELDWSYEPEGDEISTTIHITYGELRSTRNYSYGYEAIHSISFVTLYKNGKKEEKSFGAGDGEGNKQATIELNGKIEKLTGLSGTAGDFHGITVVTSLRFIIDGNKSYGPFGEVKGASFSFHAGNGRLVSGFNGRAGFWLDNIGLYLKPALKPAPKPAPKNIGAGPWGSLELGQLWTYEPRKSIFHISITYDDCIYSIKFYSHYLNGNVAQSKMFGSTGLKSGEVSIENDEKVNNISGTYDTKNGNIVVTSLSFTTDKNKVFGPYGVVKGTSFSLVVDNDEFIGFYGRHGTFLHAIGVYLQPKSQIVFGQWGSEEPGNEFSFAPKGLISEISVTHYDAIYSIIFTSEDDQGNVEHSQQFGSETGSKSDKIVIDIKNEKLNFISGTVREKDGVKFITSISFKTDQEKAFGPFGRVIGTAFSLPVTNGYISGFHGRASSLLDAIGVYVHPV